MREPTWFSWTRRIGLTVLAVFAGLPIWVMVTSALKPLGDVQGDFRWFPTQLTVQPFFDMWHTIPLAEYFVNSIVVATLASVSLAAPGPSSARAAGAGAICSASGSAKVPCRFSTPSGNIRCIWTPKPNNVACVLRSTGRAYRLRPSGKAKAIKLTLARPGKTLALNQQIVFPGSLSCRDTKRTMICNQDFATGAFTLAAKGSHSS